MSMGPATKKSIAFDISQEVARRIADEARASDKLTIVAYFDCGNNNRWLPLFAAHRYLSSPAGTIYVRKGYCGNWQATLPVTTESALKHFLTPPGEEICDLDVYVFVLSGEVPIPGVLEYGASTLMKEKYFPGVVADFFFIYESFFKSRMEAALPHYVWTVLSGMADPQCASADCRCPPIRYEDNDV